MFVFICTLLALPIKFLVRWAKITVKMTGWSKQKDKQLIKIKYRRQLYRGWIQRHPMDKSQPVQFSRIKVLILRDQLRYPLERDLSSGQGYLSFEQQGPVRRDAQSRQTCVNAIVFLSNKCNKIDCLNLRPTFILFIYFCSILSMK